MLRVLDLFSGIGGFSLGLERTGGFQTVAFCEIELFCQYVLKKHWPNVPIYNDVRNLDYEGTVDVICGGYPCQPFSTAGKRKGHSDDRHLWPAMFGIIKKHRPAWVICENVAGHVSMGLDEVIDDLESENYATQAFIIPACAVGLPHKRERVWVIANAKRQGLPSGFLKFSDAPTVKFAKMGSQGFENTEWKTWDCPPELPLLAYGISEKLDEPETVALGNAVVPLIPYIIGQCILYSTPTKETEKEK